MKTILLTMLMCFTLLVGRADAQVCGGATRTVRVYVRNGLEAKNLKYELFEVMPAGSDRGYEATARYLYKTFFPLEDAFLSRFWTTTAHDVGRETAEKFLAKYNADKYLKKPDGQSFRQNKYSDAISYGEIKFTTLELYDRPLLLKIFADNYKPAYFLSDFFGGCDRTNNVMLDDIVWPE